MLLHSFLDYWAREQPDAEFAVQHGRRTTYGQALDAANQFANALLGAGSQDRIKDMIVSGGENVYPSAGGKL